MAKIVFDPMHQLSFSEKVFTEELADIARIPASYYDSFVVMTNGKPMAVQIMDDPSNAEKTMAGPAYPTTVPYATFFSKAAAQAVQFAFSAAGQSEFSVASGRQLIEQRKSEISDHLNRLALLRESLFLGQPDWAAALTR